MHRERWTSVPPVLSAVKAERVKRQARKVRSFANDEELILINGKPAIVVRGNCCVFAIDDANSRPRRRRAVRRVISTRPISEKYDQPIRYQN